jgi:chromosomal replication initiator protein
MGEKSAAKWQTFLDSLETELGKQTIDRWARSLQVIHTSDDQLVLSAKDSFQTLWFEEHLRPRLRSFVNPLGAPVKVTLQTTKSPPKAIQAKAPIPTLHFSPLDPTSTFDTFMKIPDNEIVLRVLNETCNFLVNERFHKISALVTHERSSPPPNPIYICGPSGSGKTHLLSATAHRLRQAGLSVVIARADLFTDHVVKSIRSGEMSTFRQLWRNTDALLIDDIYLLAKKNATQEEFFHTFNSLHVAGKQIILSSNCFPQQLQFIEPRLVSRFEWGIVLPLQPLLKRQFPALLEKKAALLQCQMSQKVILSIADMFSSTPKACVQALQALIQRFKLAKNKSVHLEMSLSAVHDLLADLLEEEQLLAMTPEKIISITAETYGLKREDLLGKSQSRECVLPRQISMYLMRKHLRMPYMTIGDYFQKNHSTIMSAIRQVEKMIPDISKDIGSSIASIEIKLAELR